MGVDREPEGFPAVLGFRIVAPITESQKVRLLAQEIRDPAHFAEILADIPDPVLRAEVQLLLEPMLSFDLPAPNADGD